MGMVLLIVGLSYALLLQFADGDIVTLERSRSGGLQRASTSREVDWWVDEGDIMLFGRPSDNGPTGLPHREQNARHQRRTQPPAMEDEHAYLASGLLSVNPNGGHPIYDLIEHSNREWKAKLSKSSRTLKQAVQEYRRRYGRQPPKGFDRWYVSGCGMF